MYSILYAVAGTGFVLSVLAYSKFCWNLSLDIKEGRLLVQEQASKV